MRAHTRAAALRRSTPLIHSPDVDLASLRARLLLLPSARRAPAARSSSPAAAAAAAAADCAAAPPNMPRARALHALRGCRALLAEWAQLRQGAEA